MNLSFFIPCLPPTATAQGKGAMAMPGGGVRFFKRKAQAAAERTWHALLQPHTPPVPLQGPLTLVVDLVYPWRKTEKKTILRSFSRYPVATRPDVDNIYKALGDVMTTLRYWNDDGQVASLTVRKWYGDKPGIGVSLAGALAYDKDGKAMQP